MSAAWIGLLKTIVIPAGVTLVALCALATLGPRRARPVRVRVPVATALGFAAGSIAILGWSPALAPWRNLWPPDPTARMAAYALIVLAGALLAATLPERKRLPWVALRVLVQLAAIGIPVALLLEPRMRHAWSTPQSIAAVASLGAVGTIWWNAIGSAATRRPGASLLCTLVAVTVAGAPILFLAGSTSLAQQGVMLGVVLGVCAVGAWFRPDLADTREVGALPAGLLVLLWGAGLFYSEDPVPPLGLALMGLAPLTVWLALAPRIRRWPGWAAGLAQVGAVLLLMGAAGGAVAGLDGEGTPEREPTPAPGGIDWDS